MVEVYRKRKRKRNYNLKRYARNHPNMTLEAIGKVYHITKQRVSIIVGSRKDRKPIRQTPHADFIAKFQKALKLVNTGKIQGVQLRLDEKPGETIAKI